MTVRLTLIQTKTNNHVFDLDEPELAMAYANRSASLLHLGDYSRALGDIELALDSGYPIDLRYKLIERRAKCLLGLGRPPAEIKSACGSAVDAVRQSPLNDAKRSQFERDIQKLIQDAATLPIKPAIVKGDEPT